MTKNILYVIPEMNSGGVEVTMLELAKKNFEEKKINMFLLTTGGNMLLKMKSYGVTCITFNVKTKNPFIIKKNIKKIEKLIKDNKIDLVQVESRAPAWSCYFACKNLNIPLITTINGLYDSSNIFKRIYNSSICRGNPIITVSEYAREYLLKYYKKYVYRKTFRKTVEVIYRSIDYNTYSSDNVSINRVLELQNKLNLPDDKIIILLPARFSKQKGQDYFLRVLKYLNSDNYFCLFIGDTKKKPKYVKSVEKLIYKYELQRNVKTFDNISDMPALYKLSNIVISSSIKPESFGRVAIEAQAMEKIFIGTNIGGTLETVVDGETGFLAPYNNPKEFAAVLERVLNLSPEEQKTITNKARATVIKKFTIDNMYNSLISLYNETLASDDFRFRN